MLLWEKASDEAPGYRKPILDATENMQRLITDIQNLQWPERAVWNLHECRD